MLFRSINCRPLEPESEFIIKVQDINDSEPRFLEGPYTANVPEMSPAGITCNKTPIESLYPGGETGTSIPSLYPGSEIGTLLPSPYPGGQSVGCGSIRQWVDRDEL